MLRTTEKILFRVSHFPTARGLGKVLIVGEKVPDDVNGIRR